MSVKSVQWTLSRAEIRTSQSCQLQRMLMRGGEIHILHQYSNNCHSPAGSRVLEVLHSTLSGYRHSGHHSL
jgi:hypothetical protein